MAILSKGATFVGRLGVRADLQDPLVSNFSIPL